MPAIPAARLTKADSALSLQPSHNEGALGTALDKWTGDQRRADQGGGCADNSRPSSTVEGVALAFALPCIAPPLAPSDYDRQSFSVSFPLRPRSA